MKKVLSITVIMVFLLSLFTPAVYAADGDYQRVLNDVNKTNAEINELIKHAVQDAEDETTNYLKNLRVLQYGKEVVEVENQIVTLNNQLEKLDVNKKDYQEIHDKISKEIEKKDEQKAKILKDQNEKETKLLSDLEDLKAQLAASNDTSKKQIKILSSINKFEEQLDNQDTQIQEFNGKFNGRINSIIKHLINDTNKKAADMKERAADKGYTVICELVTVEVGGQSILIDPLRICGD